MAGHRVKDAINLTAGTQKRPKILPRSFQTPVCETHSQGKIRHWWWRVQLAIRFQVTCAAKVFQILINKKRLALCKFLPLGLIGRVIMVW